MSDKQELLQKMPTGDNPQVELLREGAAIVRLENNTQMQIAVQRPRDEVKILSDALKELDTYPSMADEVMYRKPVGKDDSNVMKYAEGLSIRAAESLANRWTNSAFGCEFVSEDSESVTISAVFLDYENNTRHVLSKKVSRYYKAKGGAKVLHPPDRFADVVIPANQSKLLREVINRSLPAGLKKEYENKARMIMNSGDTKKRTTQLIAGFMRLGVPKSKLEELAGKKIEDLTAEEIADLIAVGNAIRDGETTIEQMIVEKSAGDKLADRLGNIKSVPEETSKTSPTAQAGAGQALNASKPLNASSEGLTGSRLALWGKIADMAGGEPVEMGKIASNLSGGKITDRETLITAADIVVQEAITKMTGGKKS